MVGNEGVAGGWWRGMVRGVVLPNCFDTLNGG
jgi:hypothetical protein